MSIWAAALLPHTDRMQDALLFWVSRHGVLKELDTALYDVVVVSPRNYFLFTPLLPGIYHKMLLK